MLPYLFILPWILGVIIFQAYPILDSFYHSFTIYDVFQPANWIGIRNYVNLVENSYTRKALLNTLLYVVVSVPGGLAVAGVASERKGARAPAFSHVGDCAGHGACGRRRGGVGLYLESLAGADQQYHGGAGSAVATKLDHRSYYGQVDLHLHDDPGRHRHADLPGRAAERAPGALRRLQNRRRTLAADVLQRNAAAADPLHSVQPIDQPDRRLSVLHRPHVNDRGRSCWRLYLLRAAYL